MNEEDAGPSKRKIPETLQLNLQSRDTNDIALSLTSPSLADLSLVNQQGMDYMMPSTSPQLKRSKTLPRLGTAPEVIVDLDVQKLNRFRQWLLCIALVVFDLDQGPMIKTVMPAAQLSDSQRQNIAFAAFPDSSNIQSGTQIHSFRIHHSPEKLKPEAIDSTLMGPSDSFLYGYSLFHQQRDRLSKRGYLQRSVVLLSGHALPCLFTELLLRLAPSFLKHGMDVLEIACHNISSWPPPKIGSTLELGCIGTVLNVELPQNCDQQQLFGTSSFGEKYDPDTHILASLPPSHPPAVSLFASILPSLWSLWECLILSEPILVFSPSPSIVSAAVWWLRDMLRPIPLSGDFRPYLVLQDQDMRQIVNKGPPKPGLIIGTTNPFIHEECKHWPNILSLGWGDASAGGRSKVPTSQGPAPGWNTSHKRYISKDRVLLKKLEDSLVSSDRKIRVQASISLRQHFSARTTAILVPLNRYLTSSLIPTPTTSPRLTPSLSAPSTPASRFTSPNLSVPGSARPDRLGSFNHANFLASLKANGSPLPFRSASRQKEFYERWLRTNAFSAWLMREEGVVNEILKERSRVRLDSSSSETNSFILQ